MKTDTELLQQVVKDKAVTEPIVNKALLVGLIAAIFEVLLSFGVELSARQVAAITALLLIGVPVAVAIWARRKTWSPATIYQVFGDTIDRHLTAVKRQQ